MKYTLYSEIALSEDMPEYGFCKGDIGTIAEYYEGRPGQEPGYSLEIFSTLGDVIKVITVSESKITQLNKKSVFNMRELAGVS